MNVCTGRKPIKICFKKEIRKVSNVPDNYQALCDLVSKTFISHLPSDWFLEYEDVDGDLVMLTDDGDYKIMLECEEKTDKKCMKLFVKPKALNESASRSDISGIPMAESLLLTDEFNKNREGAGKQQEEQALKQKNDLKILEEEAKMTDDRDYKTMLECEEKTDKKCMKLFVKPKALNESASRSDISGIPMAESMLLTDEFNKNREGARKQQEEQALKQKDDLKILEEKEEAKMKENQIPVKLEGDEFKVKLEDEGEDDSSYDVELLEIGLVASSPLINVRDEIIYRIVLGNSGMNTWAENSILTNIAGVRGNSIFLPKLAPGEQFEGYLNLENPAKAGDYVSIWRLGYTDGGNGLKYSGEPVIIEFTVFPTKSQQIKGNSLPQNDKNVFHKIKTMIKTLKKRHPIKAINYAQKLSKIFPDAHFLNLLEFTSQMRNKSFNEIVERYLMSR